MKNLLFFLVLAAHLVSFNAFAEEETELELLTPEQYASLYEADKIAYLKILRLTAADLSFQESLGFFERLKVTAPVWAQLLSTTTYARELTENDLRLQLNLLNKQADDYLASRNAVDFARQATTNLVNRAADLRQKNEKARIVDSLFRRRNVVLNRILLLPERSQINLARSLRSLDTKFHRVKVKARGLGLPRLRSAVQASLDAYSDKLRQLNAPAYQIARQPGLQVEVVERASDPYRPDNASVPTGPAVVSAESCVRCIYGGFPISKTTSCSPVKTSAQIAEHLGELQLPPPIKMEDMNCGDAKPVMCNPLFFGTLGGKSVCVAPSSSATRACMNTTGNSEESFRTTDQFLRANVPAARSMMARLTNVCRNQSLCYAGAKKSDIQQTCAVVRERILKFKEGMRSIRESAPAPAAPPATPAPANTTIST